MLMPCSFFQVCRQMEKLHFTPPPPPTSPPPPLNPSEEYQHSGGPSPCSPPYPVSPPPLVNRLGGTDIERSQYMLVPEVDQLRGENSAMQEALARQESELQCLRNALSGTREEKERLKKRVCDIICKCTNVPESVYLKIYF